MFRRPATDPARQQNNRRMFSRIRGHFDELFSGTYDDPFIEDLQEIMLECENDD